MVGRFHLLDPPALATLELEAPIALFLDFDGTLVELASTPGSIVVGDQLRIGLSKLADRLGGRLALVSGRSIEDLEKHLGPLPITRAGSHGAAILRPDGSHLGKPPTGVSDAVRSLSREFAGKEGLDLEEKPHGLALHFRARPYLEESACAYAEKIADEYDLATKHGKFVVELVERGADKGRAVRSIMSEAPFVGATPFFIGDDATDEDGFEACQSLGGGAILVGERNNSCANYALQGVGAVHHWLEFE